MNKRHYEHTLPNIRGSLSNTYSLNIMVEYHHIDISVDKAICYLKEHDEELFAVFQPFFIELQRFCAEYQHNYKSQF
jgi:hypothetical protein